MRELFLRYFKVSIFSSIIFMIMGLLLFINPEGIISAFSIIIGTFILLYGISKTIVYLKNRDFASGDLMIIFAIVCGILLISNTNIIATIIPIIIGVCMIGIGTKRLELSLKFKDSNIRGWSTMFIMAILTILCGIILIINPVKGAFIATKIIGIIIIFYSIIDIISNMIWKDNIKKITKIIEEK